MRFLATALLATALLVNAIPSAACSCARSGEVCRVLKPQGDAVFLGTVIFKQLGDGRNPDGTLSLVVPSVVRFSVTEAYKGVNRNEIEINTTEGCCACGYPFQVGKAYLVYANRYGGKLTTSTCTDTQPAVTAAAVIRQFRAFQRGIGVASVFGEVTRMPQDARIEGREKRTPMGGVKVRLVGGNNTEFTAESDADGSYEFRDLPPDIYEIQSLLPPGSNTREHLDKETIKVSVETGKSCQSDIGVYSDGRISGRVVKPNGQPAPGFVSVELADPEERQAALGKGGLPGFDTGLDGHFALTLLWPGKYRIRFAGKVGEQMDFEKTYYYPHVIEISEGQHVDDIVFVAGDASQ